MQHVGKLAPIDRQAQAQDTGDGGTRRRRRQAFERRGTNLDKRQCVRSTELMERSDWYSRATFGEPQDAAAGRLEREVGEARPVGHWVVDALDPQATLRQLPQQ